MRNLRRRSSRRGFALLLVLIIVSFAAAIAVLFLLSAKQERSGTDSYAQGSRVRQLADTAVNIVIGQINTATREGTSATPISWASQPGMIRTYTQAGNLSKAYKLYSWNHMVEGATSGAITTDPAAPAFNPVAASTTEFPPTGWANLTSQYTDLNAPVTTSNPAGGTVSVYPIMDPTIANFTTSSFSATPAVSTAGSVTWDFPRELSVATDAAGYSTTGTTNTLPMPVQWLYVLQDGTWTYPTGATGGVVQFDSTVVTSANPIVGRIAFWTDDETCKVNLNTAGEGSYWDVPKAASQDEMQFAGNPPAKNEFYRNSGHPASTSLSAIFPELMGSGAGFPRWSYTGTGLANTTFTNGLMALMSGLTTTSNSIAGLSPRYSYGSKVSGVTYTGSRGGTYPASYYQFYNPTNAVGSGSFINGNLYANVSTYSPVPLNTYRLYATPDELYFSPGQQGPASTKFRGGSSPTPGAATSFGYQNPALAGSLATLATPFTPLQLSQRNFLMTTLSKAPETTLFNTPRVSLWPVTWPYPNSYYASDALLPAATRGVTSYPSYGINPNNNTLRDLANAKYGTPAPSTPNCITPQEDLIAFCSTLNAAATGSPVSGAYSNAPLPYYFQRQVLDSPTSDFVKITRNQHLANYIRGMMHQKIPGFGTSLDDTSHWGSSNADWIALECLDFSRSMVNQVTYDPNSSTGTILYSYTGHSTANTFPGDRMSYTAPPLRLGTTELTGLSNFLQNGATPLTNSAATGISETAAYVTQGSFPSLKEVALMFIATARQWPAYVGSNTPQVWPTTPAAVTGTNFLRDPFYWRNLINPGPNYGGLPDPGTSGTTGAENWADGNPTGTSGTVLETGTAPFYPVGSQTTQMQGIMVLNFAQLRDGINVAMTPNFWVRVDGMASLTVATPGGLGNGNGPVSYFPSSASVECHYRSYGADIPFSAMRFTNNNPAGSGLFTLIGKSFNSSSVSGGQSNWPLCTSMIPVTPVQDIVAGKTNDNLSFTLGNGNITVSIYAGYPANDGTHTVDQDPTGMGSSAQDTSQFITSYNLTFPGGTLPVPISPRWNQRQGPGVWYPNPAYSGTTGVKGWWAAEMAPEYQTFGNWKWSGNSPTTSGDITDANVRDSKVLASWMDPSTFPPNTTSAPYGLDTSGTTTPSAWMMYAGPFNIATAYNPTGTTNPSLNPYTTGTYVANTNGTTLPVSGFSMSMTNRLDVTRSSGGVVGAEGTPSTTTPGGAPSTLIGDPLGGLSSGTSNVDAPLFTDTTFGGGSVEAPQLITPYDTVVSVLVEPSDGKYVGRQGDPRLVNNGGETVKFSDSQAVVGALDNSYPSVGAPLQPAGQYASAAVLESFPIYYPALTTPPGYTGTANPSLTATSQTGLTLFPRATVGWQRHQLGMPGSVNLTTGYHLLPAWTSKATGVINPRAPAPASGGSLFALEGNNTGTAVLGSAQDYSNGIGLETNAYLQMNPDWDWTSSSGNAFDGGYVERPEQDYQTFYLASTYVNGLGTPYFSRSGISSYSQANTSVGTQQYASTIFSPNRQIPSPIVLGTLPSSMTQGWQTLAFCPNPAGVIDAAPATASAATPATANPGVATLNATPSPVNPPYSTGFPDHLLLDLFWMPVGEPYPISEQFSTSGKINLNYAVMPFPYIQRKTGLDAVLKSVMIYSIPDTGTIPQDYKSWFFMGNASTYASGTGIGRNRTNTRFPINVDATLNAFDFKFLNGDIFRSASQICDMFLYPNSNTAANTLLSGVTADVGAFPGPSSSIFTWWKTSGRLTSDNGREAPYNAIYSRITTQSNTYTVHWKVQALHQITADASASPPVWSDGVDRVVSELRGSTLIERYIDPNAGSTAANSIPDYANPASGTGVNWQTLSSSNPDPITYYYKWRVDNETYFQPGP